MEVSVPSFGEATLAPQVSPIQSHQVSQVLAGAGHWDGVAQHRATLG